MANKDYLMRQIESLEDLFKKLFSKIFNTNGIEISEASIAEIGDLLKHITGLDLREIANANEEDFLNSLLEKKLNAADLNNLIVVLVELAKALKTEAIDLNRERFAMKAICIDNYMTKNLKTIYYANASSIEQARDLIKK